MIRYVLVWYIGTEVYAKSYRTRKGVEKAAVRKIEETNSNIKIVTWKDGERVDEEIFG